MKKRIGRYQIDSEPEAGAPFPGYLAFDVESGRNVVLECIPATGSDEIERRESRQANRDKAEQATALRHERIAQTYEVLEQDGELWVAREPVRGETLENLLCTDAAISKDLISLVLYHSAHAFDYAHQLGIQHGRLSPAELVFLDDGTLKIVGFWRPCLASSGDVSAFDPTHYSPPEQIRGLPPTSASDQYSLAAIAYELLTGVPPFQGDAIAVRNRIVLDAPEDPSKFNASLVRDAAGVLRRALNKAPVDRFASCGDFVRALDEALETPPVWRLPVEYHGHSLNLSPEKAPERLEGEVTESLLREVLDERRTPRKSLQAVHNHAKAAGLGVVAVIAGILMLVWALGSWPGRGASAHLRVSPASLPSAVVHQPYSYSLQVRGGHAPYQWSIVEGQLPDGFILDPQGTIRGQPEATGVFGLLVQVRSADSGGSTARQQLSLTVKQGPRTKAADVLPVAVLGREYEHSLGVEGGQRPYRWSVTSGTLPPGLSLNSFSGFFRGRAEAAGVYRFSVSVSDLFGATSTRTFELTVQPAGDSDAVQRVAQVAGDAVSPGE
jgi:serine/threonine protein kinase